jgi:hypothetical protein
VGDVARIGERKGAYWSFVGIPEGKIPLGRPKHMWDDTIKMDLQEVGRRAWTVDLAQERDRWRTLVSAVMNFRVP